MRSASRDSFRRSRRAAISTPRACTACACACIATRWRTAARPRWRRRLGVDAVDHCNYIRKYDVRAIAERGIVTVACPATIAYLDLPQRAPVRALLEAGGTVALASDYNPGTSPCFNLQTVAYFGRKIFGLSRRRGAVRRDARGCALAARRCRPYPRRRPRRLRRAADRLARRVRLAVRRQSRRARRQGRHVRNVGERARSLRARARRRRAARGLRFRRARRHDRRSRRLSRRARRGARPATRARFRPIGSSFRASSTATATRIRFCCAAGPTIGRSRNGAATRSTASCRS